jgi:hypothetical protein
VYAHTEDVGGVGVCTHSLAARLYTHSYEHTDLVHVYAHTHFTPTPSKWSNKNIVRGYGSMNAMRLHTHSGEAAWTQYLKFKCIMQSSIYVATDVATAGEVCI